MRKCFRKAVSFLLCVAVLFGFPYPGDMPEVSAAEPIVVVIDPGHGGNNLGTDYLPIPEKDYTLLVAQYMKEQLEKYRNVEVYLTHAEDVSMSLEARAEFARQVNADFLFSLHFNMSLPHTLYGSEIWIPSTGTLYTQGYSAGYEFLAQFAQMGLFNRGIKTRIGNKGDYYGIIRECTARDIPAIIVEHCHVDNINDIGYIWSADLLKELGVRDAEAVARYFGLTSKDGTVSYSDYAPLAIPVPAGRVYNDTTPPDYVTAMLIDCDRTGKYATVQLSAADSDSLLQYYAYSTDGGLTWSAFQPWDRTRETMTITVNMGYGNKSGLIFKVSNIYDRETMSNPLSFY
ncbi:MAG: N-acetylmuramoyl-L-alanine amidase [Roseburia sp.]|nr:N-acetylmuramoyl-L-alanine amidase [Roseburia sp.]